MSEPKSKSLASLFFPEGSGHVLDSTPLVESKRKPNFVRIFLWIFAAYNALALAGSINKEIHAQGQFDLADSKEDQRSNGLIVAVCVVGLACSKPYRD